MNRYFSESLKYLSLRLISLVCGCGGAALSILTQDPRAISVNSA